MKVLRNQQRFPGGAFSDPGVHTGNVSKLIVSGDFPQDDSRYPLVREGRVVVPFHCDTPRKRLWVQPRLEPNQYCRINELTRYTSVPILIRQTARRPIAARHTEATYFRNSLLACAGLDGAPVEIVLAILHSEMIATFYRLQTSDSTQRAFPQVKIKHLRDLPLFERERLTLPGDSSQTLEAFIKAKVEGLESDAVLREDYEQRGETWEELELAVLRLYNLPAALLDEFRRQDAAC